MSLPSVQVSAETAVAISRGYPWVYRNQVAKWSQQPEAGGLVQVLSPSSELLGYGYANPETVIAVRILYGPSTGWRGTMGVPDEGFEIGRKLARALSRRADLMSRYQAVRLVWSEADALPGVVCDRFGDVLVVQFLTQGARRRSHLVVEWLAEHIKPRGIYERSQGFGLAAEGMEPRCGWVWRDPEKDETTTELQVTEGPLRYVVDVAEGQKTGFYLDQRATRRFLQSHRLRGRAFDGFCYSGGMALSALIGGVEHVMAVDTSRKALALLGRNAELNGLSGRVEIRRARVADVLRSEQRAGRRYELVILDPPAFARARRQREAALAGYGRLHGLAAGVLTPGGRLLTCACSRAVGARDLRLSLVAAARETGRRVKILAALRPDADHPSRAHVPESRYLHCLVARFDPA